MTRAFVRAEPREPKSAALRVLSGALILGLTLGLCSANSARAQTAAPVSPTDRSFLERLALARARANLYDRIALLPLTADLTVGDWAARDITRRRELRLWVRACPRLGNARVYSDAVCDVDVRVVPNELAARLVEMLGQQSPEQSRPPTAHDIMKAARQWPILWGTGTAMLIEKTRSRKPIGWENISVEGIQLARRGAAADSIHALLEQAGRLKVTPAYQLREFFESDDDVFEAVYEAVRDAAAIIIENAPDQVAVAQARLSMTELIRILTNVHQKHYRGDMFHAPDFREMALNAKQAVLRATGLAAPPIRYRRSPPYELIELDTPPWAKTTLAAAGRYEPIDGRELSREDRVERARYDGMNELRKKVEALIVKDGVTVERLLGYRRYLKDDVVIFLGGARVVGKPHILTDGTLTVRVELPLERLWLLIRRGMERVEVDPPEDDATLPPVQEGTP